MNGRTTAIRHYYEVNTRWMINRGSGRGEGVIHRPVWLPGAASRRQAVRSVDRLILDRLAAEARGRSSDGQRALGLLDLGCGAGSTAVWLAERLRAEITGVTLSASQVRAARERALTHGVAERCRFVEGNFLDPPAPADRRVEAAYAIESFSHAEDPDLFFSQTARRLKPGALLILCDDFRTGVEVETSGGPAAAGAAAARRRRWIAAFRSGWRLGPLIGESEAAATAGRHGFRLIERLDLSPCLRDHHLRARAVYSLLRLLPEGGPWVSSRRGGAALQVCLHRQWVRYLLLVFRKSSSPAR